MTTQRKSLSWILSVALHSALIFIAGRYTYKLAFPEGTVETVSIETFGTQNATPPPPVEKAKPAEPAVKVAPAPAPMKQKATKKVAPVFLPDKSGEQIHAEEKPETQEESPVVIPKAEEENVHTTETAAPEKPAAEPVPVPEPAAETQTEPQQAQAEPVASPQSGEGVPEEHPKFGTPGTTLDVTKLSERQGNRAPKYPFMARLRRQEGSTLIQAYVKKDGTLDSVSLYKSSGSPLLDREALDSFSRYRYVPGATGWILKTIKFTLTDSK